MKQMQAYEDSLREMFEDSCHPLKSSQTTVDGGTDRTQKDHRNLQEDTSLPEISSKKTDRVAPHAEGETLVRRGKTDNEPVIADISKASFTEKLMDEVRRFNFHKMTKSAPMYTPGSEEFSPSVNLDAFIILSVLSLLTLCQLSHELNNSFFLLSFR